MHWKMNPWANRTALLIAVVLQTTSLAAQGDRPNVVVILVDDLGYGDLSSYGAEDLQTPNVDTLVLRGMRFDQFYANCPVCSPTRASLLSGRYPELVGVPGVIRTHANNNWGYLAPNTRLLPQCFAAAGYDTMCVGKWHLGLDEASHPMSRGFDHFHGFLGDMMDDYYHHRRHDINYMRDDRQEIDPEGHATDLFSEWACDYLKSRKGNSQPFFLYLAYNAPHTPIQPPQDWLARVKDREPEISERRARLVALIEHMDAGIGQVLECLSQAGLDKNTVVVFTSDNGGQVGVGARNGELREGKGTVYEGGLKVPAAIVWPGHIPLGTQSNVVGLTMDLYPTLCELAGIKIDAPIDGVSLAKVLLGEATDLPERTVFFHRREGGIQFGGLSIQAVRQGPWKLLQNSPFAPQELYNLEADPLETHDLREENAQKFRELAEILRRHTQRGGAVPWQPPAVRDDGTDAGS